MIAIIWGFFTIAFILPAFMLAPWLIFRFIIRGAIKRFYNVI